MNNQCIAKGDNTHSFVILIQPKGISVTRGHRALRSLVVDLTVMEEIKSPVAKQLLLMKELPCMEV